MSGKETVLDVTLREARKPGGRFAVDHILNEILFEEIERLGKVAVAMLQGTVYSNLFYLADRWDNRKLEKAKEDLGNLADEISRILLNVRDEREVIESRIGKPV